MKKELKNVRIVAENGEAVLLTKERYRSLLQTLDMLASGVTDRQRRPGPAQLNGGRKSIIETG
ncbi:MAG: hypothetical protein ACOC9E_06390 [Chloroflexota bacterium]